MNPVLKKVEALISPSELDELKDALVAAGVRGMTVTETVSSPARSRSRVYRGAEYFADLVPKLKLEIVVLAESVALILQAFEEQLSTGEVWVSEVLEISKIRTGDWGTAAL